jgi:hypothetical protein
VGDYSAAITALHSARSLSYIFAYGGNLTEVDSFQASSLPAPTHQMGVSAPPTLSTVMIGAPADSPASGPTGFSPAVPVNPVTASPISSAAGAASSSSSSMSGASAPAILDSVGLSGRVGCDAVVEFFYVFFLVEYLANDLNIAPSVLSPELDLLGSEFRNSYNDLQEGSCDPDFRSIMNVSIDVIGSSRHNRQLHSYDQKSVSSSRHERQLEFVVIGHASVKGYCNGAGCSDSQSFQLFANPKARDDFVDDYMAAVTDMYSKHLLSSIIGFSGNLTEVDSFPTSQSPVMESVTVTCSDNDHFHFYVDAAHGVQTCAWLRNVGTGRTFDLLCSSKTPLGYGYVLCPRTCNRCNNIL